MDNNYYNLDNLFNCMHEGVALYEVTDDIPVNYRFLDVNNSFANLVDIEKHDLIGKKITEVFSDIDSILIDELNEVISKGMPRQFESYFNMLDKYLKVSAFIPRPGQIMIFVSDITSLKKASEALKIHQILFENAQDIILYAKYDGSIIDANKSAISKYGYSYDELLKLRIQDIRHPSTIVTFNDEMSTSDSFGITFECIHVKKDGTSFPVEVSVKSTIIDNERVRIHVIRDITERKKADERISYLANFDSLTSIPNRAHLLSRLNFEVNELSKNKLELSLMLFDIDKFKKINDTYGHDIGDIVLKETAKRVQTTIGSGNIVGRLGGDEFVIIQPQIKSNKQSAQLAEEVLKKVRKPIKLDSTELIVTISMGIAIFPIDTADLDKLMIYADKAMYLSKHNGGNSFCFYSDIND